MIDTHCHLDNKQFDSDRTEVIERAFEAGMTHLVIPAIEPARFDAVLALASSDKRIFCGMGIHPHDALKASDEALAKVEELSYGERVRAIGEIGLDYHYDFAPREVQQEVFRKQLRIAKRRNLPVIVHNRESDEDMMIILDEEQDGSLRGVLHCFSGTPEQAERAVRLGFHISFTGNITFKKSLLSETVASLPMDTIMIETDAPYMSPVPHRGKRNEPAFVGLVAEKVAEIRSMTLTDVLAQTTQNAMRFFQLSLMAFVLIGTMLASAPHQAFAQTTPEEEEEYTDPPNPYKKIIGVGGLLGLNSLTEFTSKGTQQNDGIAVGPGASIMVHIADRWAINASYVYGLNRTPTAIDPRTNKPRQDNPDEHQAFDLSLQYVVNPWNIVNFHFAAGASYLTTRFNLEETRGYFGFHANIIGISLNLKTPIGIFYPGFEYRANIVLGLNQDKSFGPNDTRTLTGFIFSVPRATLYFFPNFSGQ
jgi:TatD DNase family protein